MVERWVLQSYRDVFCDEMRVDEMVPGWICRSTLIAFRERYDAQPSRASSSAILALPVSGDKPSLREGGEAIHIFFPSG